MKKHNYLVSVFVDGRNVNTYFSENLDDLVTIKALHKNCEINIFDLNSFVIFSRNMVDSEIKKSCERWKDSVVNHVKEDVPPSIPTGKHDKVKKYWERPIKCIETGQVFSSIRECSEHLGISHKSIWNAINSGKERFGLHFVNATKY